jgi:hypothetical protein
MASEELIRKRKHLKALEDFLNSPAYVGFIVAREAEIEDLKGSILLFDIVDFKSIFAQCNARGELECLYTMLEVFPKAMEELKDRISELEDEETLVKGGR